MYKFFFVLTLSFLAVGAKHEEVDGHSLYEVRVQSAEQIGVLNDVVNRLNLDIWRYPMYQVGRAWSSSHVTSSRHSNLNFIKLELNTKLVCRTLRSGITLMVRPEKYLPPIHRFLPYSNSIVFPLKDAVADQTYAAALSLRSNSATAYAHSALEEEERVLAEVAANNKNFNFNGSLSFDRIHPYEVVDQYMVDLAVRFPNLVSVVSGGRSFEGRDIKYLRISSSNFTDTNKPVIVIQSLLHAREWITLPVSLYAIKQLVIDIKDWDLINNFDWIILPIANPDGYVFSHVRTRFWRKNRATGFTAGNICMGVDLNRNFDIHWGTASSSNPCAETFHGRAPFSESETRVVRDILFRYRSRLVMYLDIHSFGSMILFAYGNGQLPPNVLTLTVVGVRMAQAIDQVKWPENRNYIVGNIVQVLYYASGGSSDYAQFVGVPFSFTYELPAYRNNHNSLNGFLVQPEFIEQAGFETWEGIKAGARWILANRREAAKIN